MTGIPLIELPLDQNTGRLLWRNKAPQIDKPFANFIEELMHPVPGKRPKDTQEILYHLVKRLPKQLRRNQVLRSKSFGIGFAVFMVLVIIGGYKGGSWITSRITSWYYYELASDNLALNHPEAAKKNFKQAVQSNPTDVDAYESLGATCARLKDYHCAISNYQKALRINPNSWQAHNGLGKVYDDFGNYALAEKHYRIAMQLNSELAVDAINNLSRLKTRMKDYQAAADLAQEGFQKTDNSMSEAALLKNLGWARLGQNRLAEAEKHLQKSLKLDPNRASAYCLLAQVQQLQNEIDSANQNWRQCLTRDSELPEVRQWRKQFLDQSLRN